MNKVQVDDMVVFKYEVRIIIVNKTMTVQNN